MDIDDSQRDALLKLIHHALVLMRIAGGNGDAKKCFAIADAFEELPMMALSGSGRHIGLKEFERIYLAPLIGEYPDLAVLRDEWRTTAIG